MKSMSLKFPKIPSNLPKLDSTVASLTKDKPLANVAKKGEMLVDELSKDDGIVSQMAGLGASLLPKNEPDGSASGNLNAFASLLPDPPPNNPISENSNGVAGMLNALNGGPLPPSAPSTSDDQRKTLGDASNNPVFNIDGVDAQMNAPKAFNLYPNGKPTPADVDQTSVGDCYFECAMGALAQTDPDYVKKMISDNGDGTYTAHMFDPAGKPIDVSVNGDLPVDKNGSLPGNASGDGATGNWVSIAEKAFAKYNDTYKTVSDETGYAGIGRGGNAGQAFAAYTGLKSTLSNPTDAKTPEDQDKLAQSMQDKLKSGIPVTVGLGKSASLPSGATLPGGHAYSVLDVNKDSSGKWYVDVRNPWGTTADDANSSHKSDNGVVRMSMDQFTKYVDQQISPNGALLGGASEGDNSYAPEEGGAASPNSASMSDMHVTAGKAGGRDKNTGEVKVDGYTLSYAQKNGAKNTLTVTDPAGKDITPANMKNGTNGNFTLPNGATVAVSGSGKNASFSVTYQDITQKVDFRGAGKKGGYDLKGT
jgi:hypothetical protein